MKSGSNEVVKTGEENGKNWLEVATMANRGKDGQSVKIGNK